MRNLVAALVAAGACGLAASTADPACCYFSAMDKDVKQPGQRAFLTWDPVEKVESFTVQPMFEGNAEDFGMVVPTPAQPKLSEAHRDFFKSLAVYTILKPMDVKKFKSGRWAVGGAKSTAEGAVDILRKSSVKVLESGVVGSLDYKVIEANDAEALFTWLKDNKYAYSGDRETLDFYVKKRWYFTVMKIDPKQMKKRADGTYAGEVTPTRFTFESDKLIYPLRITRISVKDKTDALFYIQAPEKMDFPGELSHQLSFQTMWCTAYSFANWELCSDAEKAWWEHVKERQQELNQSVADWQKKHPGRTLSTLEWSRRLTEADLAVLTGEAPFDRQAPEEDVKKLAILGGILKKGQFVTKCRHVFWKDEMDEDLVFVEASFKGKKDSVEHVEILPTSPP